MSQTLNLYRLQQIDSQLDQAQARLRAIHEILEDDAELRLANEQIEAAQARCRSVQHTLKQAEEEVESQHIKIEQNESSLYGGTVHNPKELQDLQNDVAALKRHLATLEDRQLESMLASDEAETQRQAAEADLLVAQAHWAEQNKSLGEEQATLQSNVERLSTERAAIAEAIPRSDLDLYDRLRQQRRGLAVAAIRDHSCEACGSMLTAAQVQSAHSSAQIALCPSCGRILYEN
jgi:predicted  nucleic acid-binding Zn-ribbon protein